jgi:hypothetical protein
LRDVSQLEIVVTVYVVSVEGQILSVDDDPRGRGLGAYGVCGGDGRHR